MCTVNTERGLFKNVLLRDAEKGRNNNLNLIRFALASLVIFSHSYIATGSFSDNEPMRKYLHFGSFGGLAVLSFFFISGYLILKSGLSMKSPEHFIRARTLRIFPGLITVIFLCGLVLGPCLTVLTVQDYFANHFTWSFLQNALMRQAPVQLPGVFMTNLIRTVDAPLWTLSSEWTMYIVVLLVCIALKWKLFWKQFTLRTFIFLMFVLLITLPLLPHLSSYSIPWASFFVVGSFCYVFRSRIILNIPIALCLTILFLVLIRSFPIAGKYIFPAALAYLLLTIGYHPALHFKSFHKIGDYSYGLYIYAWPIQQILSSHPTGQAVKLFLLSYPLALLVSIASWHFIEGPCLRLKDTKIPALPPLAG